MNVTPSRICFMKQTHAFSVNTNSSSITRSNSSPPAMLENKYNLQFVREIRKMCLKTYQSRRTFKTLIFFFMHQGFDPALDYAMLFPKKTYIFCIFTLFFTY